MTMDAKRLTLDGKNGHTDASRRRSKANGLNVGGQTRSATCVKATSPAVPNYKVSNNPRTFLTDLENSSLSWLEFG